MWMHGSLRYSDKYCSYALTCVLRIGMNTEIGLSFDKYGMSQKRYNSPKLTTAI